MRNILIIVIMLVLLGATVFVLVRHSAANSKDDTVVNFLAHLEAVYPVNNGTQVFFTGNFLKIPTQLESDLRQKFPSLKFVIAQMEFLHWGKEPINLIIIVDANTEKPLSYLWDIQFDDPPFSFSWVLTSELGKLPELQGGMSCLANLIAFIMDGSVGPIVETVEHIEVVINGSQGRPWRIMSLQKKSDSILKELTFMNPVTRQSKTEPQPESNDNNGLKPSL